MIRKWCLNDVQMMCKWCANDVQMMSKWCPNDVQMMSRWCINDFPFCWCCPAGGLDLEKSWFFGNKRISFLLMLPCGRPRPWKISLFCICWMSSKCQNTIIWLDSSIRSMLELLVLKKYAECTSQRLKRTSGARVMIFAFDEHWRTL